jgi:protein-S-isoprenylcysteine O-methyltransferase Ste14
LSGKRKFWMRWRVRLGYPVAVIYWLLATPSPRWILVGGSIALIGLFVRAAAAGYLRKSEELATSGPYARTRNPLYFGSSLLAAGFAVAGASWWAAGVVMVYFAVFYYAVMRNEEQELRERYGSAFEEYAAHVPLFFPHPFGSSSGDGAPDGPPAKEFSWAQYRRNREYQALIGTIVALGFVWLRMWVPLWIPWFRR